MGGPQFPGGGPGGPMGNGPQGGQRGQVRENSPRPGMQLGPPERWWDDKSFARNLRLRPDQQARMDTIFEQNRPALLASLQGVQQAEAQMQELSKSATPNQDALFAQIDKVSQARAELEKAHTRMLLQLRKEMDPDQIKRLERYSQH